MIAAITAAILFLSTLTSGAYAPHLANHPRGPEVRAQEIAQVLVDAANTHGVDPYLLTALAYRESSFDPGAVSNVGAFGLLQTHVRWSGKEVLNRCMIYPEHCLHWQADAGAKALAYYIQVCHSEARALHAFRTGDCGRPGRNGPQTKKVLVLRNQLKAMGTGGDHG
jgi:hypothetical protein